MGHSGRQSQTQVDFTVLPSIGICKTRHVASQDIRVWSKHGEDALFMLTRRSFTRGREST